MVVALTALLLMGIWIEYVERFNISGGPLGENSPPNAAMGVILLVLGLSALLYKFRSSLRLRSRELVVIYASLVVAAPLMSQGLWGRLTGLLVAIPNNQDFKSYTSLPPQLWPHGENLAHFPTTGEPAVLKQDETKPDTPATLSFTINRLDEKGREQLIPGESFLFTALVKTENLQKNSSYFVTMQADSGPVRNVLTLTSQTKPSLALQDGYERIGASPLIIPFDMKEGLTITVGLTGPGLMRIRNLEFFNVESVEGLYSGRKIVRQSDYDKLGPDERNFTLVKPDNLLSLQGLKYLFTGFIPVGQWAGPIAAWSALILALFAGFYGLNLLMRKQWAEHERFSFPLIIIPRHLFTESVGPDGEITLPIFRNRIMWIGFACTLPLLILKGLHYYNPAIPSPDPGSTPLGSFVTSPIAKAYLQNVNMTGILFSTLSIFLLVETNILFSLWTFFFIFQLWNLFGRAINLNRIPGYPWKEQQTMGAYIGYAMVALFVARRHLVDAAKALFKGSSPDSRHYRLALALILASFGGLALWGAWVKMGWVPSLLFFGYMLVLGFSAGKIRAECGAPFAYITPYVGMQFAGALGGFTLFGPTGMLVATIASGFMTTSCFLLVAPAQLEMMELGRHFNVRLRDIGGGLTLGLVGALLIGGFVLLCWAYGFGANSLPVNWSYSQNWYFNNFRTAEAAADRALEAGTFLSIPETRTLDMVHNVDATGLGVGAGITAFLAFMRTRFMWFPLHPIGYILSSTHFMGGQWFVIFLAWAIRSLVFRIGGAQTIRKGLVPFCIGMFLACIVSILLFDGFGLILRSRGVTDIYNAMP
jgi:hypothetical protein